MPSLSVAWWAILQRMPLDEYRIANRANWDSRVDIHYASDDYGIEHFVADPDHLSDVVTLEKERVGDVSGKSLIHLQCHIGTDTVSWARLGAEVTGIDLSEKSIEAARRLSADSGTPARFFVSELYDAPTVVPEKFDIVYTGAGAICWIPDIRGWADVVASFVNPGGRFSMLESHPMLWTLDWEDTEKVSVIYPYFETVEPIAEIEEETYAGEGLVASPLNYSWNHGIGEILTALLDVGFRIDAVEEYDFCAWQGIDQMVLSDDGFWRLPKDTNRLAAMWSVTATMT